MLSEQNLPDFAAYINFAGYIEAAQKRLDIDDAALARRCKVSMPMIERWKRGASVPHLSSLAAIQAALT